mmetsp:Transcript_95634/g.276313  ORF Transcript_95634/g.276313 Transcript_95634/m.276313 type:complete len:611 (-) Transcript_95634:312-2144(-)|eukprot:CAMPEP_0176026070 /NCGR_PEP_ID=MMETSP0120_2-20121206/12766_1 /TAXON_ID=160619 /ORGANISM="Kryptoperidinium foliaceum, Strain CCMP 1326" /LENGTH=610 /DNA_ID=CAMNT_0017359265 /DNA_START=57 /DNA_END=1889 /DNA_ORIENTATION=+
MSSSAYFASVYTGDDDEQGFAFEDDLGRSPLFLSPMPMSDLNNAAFKGCDEAHGVQAISQRLCQTSWRKAEIPHKRLICAVVAVSASLTALFGLHRSAPGRGGSSGAHSSAREFAAGINVVALQGGSAATVSVFRSAKGVGELLHQLADLELKPDFEFRDGPTIDIDTSAQSQEIIGFGGAITEASASVFAKLKPHLQDEVIEKYFGLSGLGLTIGRVHINSCDFALGNYDFDGVPDDWELKHFDHNLTHDKGILIPLIARAVRKAEDAHRRLRLLATPWSPPAWMKQSGEMNSSSQPCLKDRAHRPWAEYIATWISDMKLAGLPIWALTVQNEPTNNPAWEACLTTPEEEAKWIAQHLGPVMSKRHPEVAIFAVDDQKHLLLDFLYAVMGREDAAKYVSGAAFHWYTGDWFDRVKTAHQQWPNLILLASEATYERRMWEQGRTETYSDWRFGEGYAHDIIGDLNTGTAGWTDWNIILDKSGGPNHVGNVCDAAVVADVEQQKLFFHPQFFYMGHFSKFILPGSKHVASVVEGAKPEYEQGTAAGPYGTCTGKHGLETTAALRPDGQLVVVVLNCAAEDISFKLRADGSAVLATAPQRSITTFVFPAKTK